MPSKRSSHKLHTTRTPRTPRTPRTGRLIGARGRGASPFAWKVSCPPADTIDDSPLQSRVSSRGRKRPAQDTEVDLRTQLRLDEESRRSVNQPSANHSFSPTGAGYMTVRYSGETVELLEVLPILETELTENNPPAEQGSRGLWKVCTAMFGFFKSSYAYISDKLRGHATVRRYDVVESCQPRPRGQIAIKRFKSLPPTRSQLPQELPPGDYEYRWVDDPQDYIGHDNLQAVLTVLGALQYDLGEGNISRPPECEVVSNLVDYELPINIHLSVVVYNLMVERHGSNTHQQWERTLKDLDRDLEHACTCIQKFYSADNLEFLKTAAFAPNGRTDMVDPKSWVERSALREAGGVLHFLTRQSDHFATFHGTSFPQETMMKIVADFNAYHKQEPILSFVRVGKKDYPPGHFYDEDVLEEATVDQLEIIRRCDYIYPSGSHQMPATHVNSQLPTEAPLKSCLVRRKVEKEKEDGTTTGEEKENGTPMEEEKKNSTTHETPLVKLGRVFAPISSKKKQLRFASPREFYVSPMHQPKLLGKKTEEADLDENTAWTDAADWVIWPSRVKALQSKKRKASEAVIASMAKRRRFFRPNLDMEKVSPASPDMPVIREREEQEGIFSFKQWTGAEILKQPFAFPEDDPEDPPLKISSAKQAELQAVKRHKLAREEARRLQELEEKRRKEEEERLASTGLRAPVHQAIAPMSDEWRVKVMAMLRAKPNIELAKSPEGSPLLGKDFQTVVSKTEWLNDEVVNGSLMHLANHINQKAGVGSTSQTPKCRAFSSFFWTQICNKGPAGTTRWMKRQGITKANFLAVDTMLIPICEGNHWTLVVVRPTRRTITHMDSLRREGSGRPSMTNITSQWVKGVLEEKWTDDWRVVDYTSPSQTNGWDCGVHTVTNAMFVALGLDPSHYKAAEMPLQRDRIAGTLLNGGFTGEFSLEGL